jgi:hypothetical protein
VIKVLFEVQKRFYNLFLGKFYKTIEVNLQIELYQPKQRMTKKMTRKGSGEGEGEGEGEGDEEGIRTKRKKRVKDKENK